MPKTIPNEPKVVWHPCKNGIDPVAAVLREIGRRVPVIFDADGPADLIRYSKRLADVLNEGTLHVDGLHFESRRNALIHWLQSNGFTADGIEFNERMQTLLDALPRWESAAENLIFPRTPVPKQLKDDWDIIVGDVLDTLGFLKHLGGTIAKRDAGTTSTGPLVPNAKDPKLGEVSLCILGHLRTSTNAPLNYIPIATAVRFSKESVANCCRKQLKKYLHKPNGPRSGVALNIAGQELAARFSVQIDAAMLNAKRRRYVLR